MSPPEIAFFFLMIRRPPRSTLFPTRRSSDLGPLLGVQATEPAHGAQRVYLAFVHRRRAARTGDRKSTRLNSSHPSISYAVFCLKKKKKKKIKNKINKETKKTN